MSSLLRSVSRSRLRLGQALARLLGTGADASPEARPWLAKALSSRFPQLTLPSSQERPFFTVLHERLDSAEDLTLGELVDSAGDQTYGLLILLLALPSLVPGLNVGAAPIGGLGIMWIGLQMMLGRDRPLLPQRVRRQGVHKGRTKEALAGLEKRLGRLDQGSAPRRTLNRPWMGCLVAWTGFLLALPVPLPFANQLPAVTLVLLGAALLEERPLWGWIGVLGSLANTVYFVMSFDLVVHGILKGLAVMRHWFS